MRWSIILFLLFNVLSGEEIYDTRENYFETSTAPKIAPNVNPVTGDLIEEECDLVVAGSEPLSLRRFYSHTGMYEPRTGGWRYNPETFCGANLEWKGQDRFVAVGNKNGSVVLLKPSGDTFAFDATGHTAQGGVHPLNLRFSYSKGKVDRGGNYRFHGQIREGDGTVRILESNNYCWLDYYSIVARKYGQQVAVATYTPNVWTPYQLHVQEERLPNGNIIRYDYAKWRGRRLYPTPPLLHKITAYNHNRTKVLGQITFDYDKDDRDDVKNMAVGGSDERCVLIHHHGSAPILLQESIAPGKPRLSYGYQRQWVNRVNFPDGRYKRTEYNGQQKVAAQYAPVGPNGEECPIARYTYHNKMTEVSDAEGHRTRYRYDDQGRVLAIETMEGHDVYRTQKFVWDPKTGNCVRKSLDDKLITEYTYDANHNLMIERIGDGREWHEIRRTFSTDGFNLKLSESDRKGKVTRYSYRPGTNLLLSELVYDHDKLVKRTFYTYDDCAICIRQVNDDGGSKEQSSLQGVTFRKITEIKPKYSCPCFGLPEEVSEKTINDRGQEVLLKRVVYTYAPCGKVLTEKHYDAHNRYCYTIENSYDEEERLISTRDALGHTTCFAYDANHNLIAIEGPLPEQRREIVYDKANRPIKVSERQLDGTYLVTHKTYDKLGQLLSETNACGATTRYEYDRLGRVVAIHYPDGATERKEYDTVGNVIKTIDGEGFETMSTYNFLGKPLVVSHPDGSEEHFSYHSCGTVETHRDKNGATTCYQYDIFDQPTRVTTYDSSHNVVRETTACYTPFCKVSQRDGEGVTTIYGFDYCGRKIKEQTGDREISYRYDSLGRLSETIYGDVRTIETFDHKNQVISKKVFGAALQFEESYRYDAAGRRTHVVTAGGTSEASYTTYGQPLVEKDALGHETHYSYLFGKEHQKITTDAGGIQTICVYDCRGREREVTRKNREGDTIAHSTLKYDKNGNLVEQTPTLFDGIKPLKSVTHRWEYGPNQQLKRFVESEEKESEHIYNERGQLAHVIKPSGERLYYTWDELGRLSRYMGSDFDYHYVYNRNDQILSIYDSVTETTTKRCYDAHGDLIMEELANGLTLINTFDTQGRRDSLTLPDASRISYTHDGAFLYKITRKGLTHTYSKRDWQGHLLQSELAGNLGTLSIKRDALSRCQEITAPGFHARQLTYDPMGNLLGYTYKDREGDKVCSFSFDAHNQLTRDDEHTYRFDSLFNRLEKDENQYVVNNLCQVLDDGECVYTYDEDGNLTYDGENHYTYDAQDRLVGVENNSERIEYAYDPFHRRLCKKQFTKLMFSYEWTGAETRYLWDGDDEIGAVDKSGTIQELRVLGEGLGAELGAAVLYEMRGKRYVPIHDHRGCVVEVLDVEAGVPVEHYRYTGFGEELTETKLSPWRFASKRVDEETDLVFFGRRYYNAKLGRWMTQDPEGLKNGPNLYAYVSNCALTRFDCYGLWESWWSSDSLDLPEFGYFCRRQLGRTDPRINCFETDFKNKSMTYDLKRDGRLFDGFGSVGFVNGINNTPAQARNNALYLSDCMGNRNIYGMYRGSNGITNDLWGCILNLTLHTTMEAVNAIHEVWNKHFDKNPDQVFLHFCTSGGAISTKKALIEYSEEHRNLIRVVAISPADYIPKNLCHSVVHYEVHWKKDPIPWLRFIERKKHLDTIVVLPSHPDAPRFDHSITSPTYQQPIIDEYKYYPQLIGAP